jgi:hypothetical protein
VTCNNDNDNLHDEIEACRNDDLPKQHETDCLHKLFCKYGIKSATGPCDDVIKKPPTTTEKCKSDEHRVGGICVPKDCDKVVKKGNDTVTVFCGDNDGNDHDTNTRTIIKEIPVPTPAPVPSIIEQQPVNDNKFFTVMQQNHPDNFKAGVVVDLNSTTATTCKEEYLNENLCFVHISGKITNIGNKGRMSIAPQVILYDTANHTIGAAYASLNLSDLMAGDSTPFTVDIGGKDAMDGITTIEKLKEIRHIIYRIEMLQ